MVKLKVSKEELERDKRNRGVGTESTEGKSNFQIAQERANAPERNPTIPGPREDKRTEEEKFNAQFGKVDLSNAIRGGDTATGTEGNRKTERFIIDEETGQVSGVRGKDGKITFLPPEDIAAIQRKDKLGKEVTQTALEENQKVKFFLKFLANYLETITCILLQN